MTNQESFDHALALVTRSNIAMLGSIDDNGHPNVRAMIKMENQGNYPAGDFVVQWRPTGFAAPLSMQVNGLKYGESTVVMFDYTYQLAGEFQTTATVDSTKKVWEIDEDNNSETKPVIVEPQRPDLVIASFTFDPVEPVQVRVAARG